jgi:hypothetical protein
LILRTGLPGGSQLKSTIIVATVAIWAATMTPAELKHRTAVGSHFPPHVPDVDIDRLKSPQNLAESVVEARKPLIDRVETLVDRVETHIDGVEALVDIRDELVKASVCPGGSHRLHAPSLGGTGA